MNDMLRQMEQAKQFRQARERVSRTALAMASSKLREAEVRLEKLRRAEAEEAELSSQIPNGGASQSRAMSNALMQAFGMDGKRQLNEIRRNEIRVAEAQSELRALRMETEQMVALCKKEHEAALVQMERHTQTDTVDRFLARSRWSSAKVRVRNFGEAA